MRQAQYGRETAVKPQNRPHSHPRWEQARYGHEIVVGAWIGGALTR